MSENTQETKINKNQKRYVLTFIILSLIALIFIVKGTIVSFSENHNYIYIRMGQAGYILLGFNIICLYHIKDIIEITKCWRIKWLSFK